MVRKALGTYKIHLCIIYFNAAPENKKVALTGIQTKVHAATTQGANHYTIDADSWKGFWHQ